MLRRKQALDWRAHDFLFLQAVLSIYYFSVPRGSGFPEVECPDPSADTTRGVSAESLPISNHLANQPISKVCLFVILILIVLKDHYQLFGAMES